MGNDCAQLGLQDECSGAQLMPRVSYLLSADFDIQVVSCQDCYHVLMQAALNPASLRWQKVMETMLQKSLSLKFLQAAQTKALLSSNHCKALGPQSCRAPSLAAQLHLVNRANGTPNLGQSSAHRYNDPWARFGHMLSPSWASDGLSITATVELQWSTCPKAGQKIWETASRRIACQWTISFAACVRHRPNQLRRKNPKPPQAKV